MSKTPLAYFLTFHAYGSWLPGSGKGSIDRDHNCSDTPWRSKNRTLEEKARGFMKTPPVKFEAMERGIIDTTIREVAKFRGWEILALNVRTNHVHVVVRSDATPEKTMGDMKARVTRILRERGLVRDERIWGRHGSTRYLWTEASVENACRYVTEGQGVDLPMG